MKKVIIILGCILILLIGGFSITKLLDNDNYQPTKDEIKFKTEYESMNNKKWEFEGYKGNYLKINIPDNNLVKYATDKNILDLVTNGTHVIYFGNAGCNWCRSAVSVLIDAAKSEELEEIYYYDFFTLRDAYEEGSNKELVSLYESLMNEMGEFIDKTFDDESRVAVKKRLSAPTVVIVSSGKVVDLHYKTVDSHIDYNKDLNDKEKKELKDKYLDMFKKLIYACDGGC